MTKNELWEIYCTKNPSFEQEGNVTMSTKGLRKLFETTWDQAIQSTYKPYKEEEDLGLKDLMNIFGMK
jgi:hypothetical protein